MIQKKIRTLKRRIAQYGWGHTGIYIIWRMLPKIVGMHLLGYCVKVLSIFGIKKLRAIVNNVSLYVDPRNTWVLREYFIMGDYDQNEIDIMRRCIPSDYTFIDIGANFGAWTFSLANHFDCIWAVEPDPRCFKCLFMTRQSLRKENVNLIEAALADRDGEGKLFTIDSHMGDSRIFDPRDGRSGGIPINVLRFDTLVKERGIAVGKMLIKLDAQGVEPKIIQGMVQSLQRTQDVIIRTEVQESVLAASGYSAKEYLGLLRDVGFKPVDLRGNLRPMSWQEAEDCLKNEKDLCFRNLKS